MLDVALSRYPAARDGIDLEITESVLAGDVEEISKKSRP
jgi:hypothetical protein